MPFAFPPESVFAFAGIRTRHRIMANRPVFKVGDRIGAVPQNTSAARKSHKVRLARFAKPRFGELRLRRLAIMANYSFLH
jgi:hypothetical protein